VFEHPIVLGVGFALILFLLAPLITDWLPRSCSLWSL
jgi:hypothetical protein